MSRVKRWIGGVAVMMVVFTEAPQISIIHRSGAVTRDLPTLDRMAGIFAGIEGQRLR